MLVRHAVPARRWWRRGLPSLSVAGFTAHHHSLLLHLCPASGAIAHPLFLTTLSPSYFPDISLRSFSFSLTPSLPPPFLTPCVSLELAFGLTPTLTLSRKACIYSYSFHSQCPVLSVSLCGGFWDIWIKSTKEVIQGGRPVGGISSGHFGAYTWGGVGVAVEETPEGSGRAYKGWLGPAAAEKSSSC